MHIIKSNFLRFTEQKTLVKNMTSMITTCVCVCVCVCVFDGAMLTSPGSSVAREKKRQSRVKLL